MSEAPAVYYPKQTEPDGSTITIGKYVHWDIFDAYRAAVDAWLTWHENRFTTITKEQLLQDQQLHEEAIGLMQAARKAGESVR